MSNLYLNKEELHLLSRAVKTEILRIKLMVEGIETKDPYLKNESFDENLSSMRYKYEKLIRLQWKLNNKMDNDLN